MLPKLEAAHKACVALQPRLDRPELAALTRPRPGKLHVIAAQPWWRWRHEGSVTSIRLRVAWLNQTPGEELEIIGRSCCLVVCVADARGSPSRSALPRPAGGG